MKRGSHSTILGPSDKPTILRDEENHNSVKVDTLKRRYVNPPGFSSYRRVMEVLEPSIQVRINRWQMAAMLEAANAAEPTHVVTMGKDQPLGHHPGDLAFWSAQYICAVSMSINAWPLYWVGPELLMAALATDLPDDLKLQDVKWPHDGLTFMLPTLSYAVGSGHLQFITLARMNNNVEAVDRVVGKHAKIDLPGFLDQFNDSFIVLAAHSSDNVAVTNFKLQGTVGSLSLKAADAWDIDKTLFDKTDLPYEDSPELAVDLTKLALNLMLIMQARRELLTGGRIIKRSRMKRGEKTPELWEPRWIGRNYTLQREDQTATGERGTHRSPRLHWRRGHWRNVVRGVRVVHREGERVVLPPSQREHEMKWIEAVLVKGGGEDGSTGNRPTPKGDRGQDVPKAEGQVPSVRGADVEGDGNDRPSDSAVAGRDERTVEPKTGAREL